MRRHSFFLLLLLAFLSQPATAQEGSLIFLVRHAERADDGKEAQDEDPHLSEAGFARAQALAVMLTDVELTHVHSTDFVRTRETGTPTAESHGLGVTIYDHRTPAEFAYWLRSTPGRHLVVGHSNSTPALVEALGGDPHGAIDHLEYDRLYLIVFGSMGAETVLLRFGEPFQPSH